MTNRLSAFVLSKLRDTRSYTSVTQEVGLSTTTVMRIFDTVKYGKPKLPRVLAIDEFKGNTNDEKYQCIITDAENKVVLDILPKRFESYLIHYFKDTGKATGCTKYITIPDDYRLSIDRNAIHFKAVYALRTEAERYNSRFKQAGCERVFVRNGNSVKNLNTIAHISLLAIAIATVSLAKPISYRCTKSVKRIS